MGKKLQLVGILTTLIITSNTFPVYAATPDRLPNFSLYDSDLSAEWETVSSGDPFSSDASSQELPDAKTDSSGTTFPDEAPMFSARIEYFGGQGYLARGTFMEFLPDTSLVQPLYSLDGEEWQPCQTTWNLQWLGKDSLEDQNALQNQTCLLGNHEPLASYLAGQLDRFYLKLQITLESGIVYDTQAAVIDRGTPQPVPEEFTPVADFAPAIRIRQWRPFKSHGQYQITVSADTTPEEISALLPKTLPIKIDLYKGINFVTDAVVNCPVTWNPLSLSRLTPGESITIEDAAEEIIVPAGTLLSTPTGIFQLSEPLGFDHDQVKLVLNVVENSAEPTGTLHGYFAGLEISFNLKPTGATAIRAYTLSEGESSWVEVPDPLLPEKVNAPSATASSLLTFVLTRAQEPYSSWLAAWNAAEEPRPFLVGLIIEGGVYDGRQLILAYPDTYQIPLQPPAISGSGGNEGNAGSDNKNDSTSEGQRPDLPQDTEDGSDTQNPASPDTPKGDQNSQEPNDEQDSQKTDLLQEPDNSQDPQEAGTNQGAGNGQNPQETGADQDADNGHDSRETKTAQVTGNGQASQKPRPMQAPESEQHAQEPDLTQILSVKPKDSPMDLIQPFKDSDGTLEWIPSVDGGTDSTALEKTTDVTGHDLQWLFPATAAIAAIGICITAAVGKATAGSISVRISGKIMRALHSLFHLK